jgi:hypothetical protein
MFTMKKLALVGIAGLAALSISCSDDGDESGGTLAGFSAVDGENVTLKGKITPNEGSSIQNIAFTSNGTALVATWAAAPLLPSTAEINLDGRVVAGVCAANGNTSGSYKIKIVVIFDVGDKIEEETPSFPVTCSGGGATLDSWDFSLSTAADSYADLDGKQTYRASSGSAPLGAIDIVAFYPAGGCTNGFICSPDVISVLTGEAYIIPVPAELKTAVAAALNNATAATLSTFKTTYGGMIDDWEEELSVNIVDGEWFLVDSTEEELFAVKIVSSTDGSVSLKSLSLQ